MTESLLCSLVWILTVSSVCSSPTFSPVWGLLIPDKVALPGRVPESLSVCVCCHSVMCDSATPWAVARQDFSRRGSWSGLLFPTPRHLPNLGIKASLLLSPTLAAGFFTTAPPCYRSQREISGSGRLIQQTNSKEHWGKDLAWVSGCVKWQCLEESWTRSLLSNMVATRLRWLWSACNVASLNWDVLQR